MKLPVVSGRDVGHALERIGFQFVGQKGSHRHYRRTTAPHTKVSVPDHREIKKGTLKAILRAAGLSNERLVDLLKAG